MQQRNLTDFIQNRVRNIGLPSFIFKHLVNIDNSKSSIDDTPELFNITNEVLDKSPAISEKVKPKIKTMNENTKQAETIEFQKAQLKPISPYLKELKKSKSSQTSLKKSTEKTDSQAIDIKATTHQNGPSQSKLSDQSFQFESKQSVEIHREGSSDQTEIDSLERANLEAQAIRSDLH